MEKLHKVAFILLVIGGLNWLVFALTNGWDVSQLVGGMDSLWAKIIYVVIGLAAISELVSHPKNCAQCKSKGPSGSVPGSTV